MLKIKKIILSSIVFFSVFSFSFVLPMECFGIYTDFFGISQTKAQGAGVGIETGHSGVTGASMTAEEKATPPAERTTGVLSPVDPNDYKPQLSITIGQTKIAFNEVNCEGGKCSIPWISQYISALYAYGVGAAAILAMVMIMVGGFIWLLSAGSPDKVGKAKEFITSALTGLLLALFSFLILNTVNPKLTSLDTLQVNDIRYIAPDALSSPSWTVQGGGGTGGSGGAACTGNSTVGAYDFSRYAEAGCAHVQAVNGYYQQMAGKINNANDAQKFIKQFAPNSPITGEMVMTAANQFGADKQIDPAVIIAEMIQDSSLGSNGSTDWAVRTNNPGNIGNWGTLNQGTGAPAVTITRNEDEHYSQTTQGKPVTYSSRTYDSWQDGVSGIGLWLNKHPAKK
ncbi:MAG: pilin [Candidatus Buchananbacteria bacterium]